MSEKVKPDYDVMDLIKNHWSPRSFLDKTVETEKLQKVFEAARWSSSCFNEQPWRFLLATKDHGEVYNKLFDCITENNQKWAKTAPVIIAVLSKKSFSINNNPNGWNEYDAGQSVGFLTLQAHNEGLYAHQMAGIHKDKLISSFNIPDDFEAICIITLGYLGSADDLPEDLKQRELAESKRKPISEFVFSDEWEKKSNII